VDGLPLAIELAAARVNVLTPQQIVDRLDHRLTLLSGSRRDVTDRQRTLRGAIDWSHDLLSDDEKAGFRRFSVFAGGAQLEAVLAVVDPDAALSTDAIDLVGGLVDRSLIRLSEDTNGSRFSMLETIREYAAESLNDSDEEDVVRNRHADFFCAIAEAAIDVLRAPNRDKQLDALDLEMPNFRAAVECSIECGAFDRAARMAVGLKEFWRTRSHIAESRRLLDRLLSEWPAGEFQAARADVLGVASELASWNTDYARSRELTQVHIDLLSQLGDTAGLAQAYNNMAWGNLLMQPDVAREMFEKAVELAHEVGDAKNLVTGNQGLAIALFRVGELEEARRTAQIAVELAHESGDEYTNLFNIMTLGIIELRMGNRARCAELFTEALHRADAASAAMGTIPALDAISLLAFESGAIGDAATLALVAERLRAEIGGAPAMDLVGQGRMLDRIATADSAALEQARTTIATVTTEDAIATAYSVTAAISSTAARTEP
jgi:tetratricopeptide (TPR) repeat protein